MCTLALEEIKSMMTSRIREARGLLLEIMYDKSLMNEVGTVAHLMASSLKHGGKVIFIGNGGSAAEAQHLAAELMGKFKMDRKPLPALALTVNTSVLTAVANDYAYDDVFVRQAEALVQPGDIIVGMSTSGKSVNVIEALNVAKAKGAYTVAMTGQNPGPMVLFDRVIDVPSSDTARIQEAHLVIGHLICEVVEKELFGGTLDEGDIS